LTSYPIGAYCWYNNDIANKDTYGALYNWYAVNDVRHLCPTGWHIPSYNEWGTFINYLGGLTLVDGKLKESGTTHWINPNLDATNSSGFTALPGGRRDYHGAFFVGLGREAYFWSSTSANNGSAAYYFILYNDNNIGHMFEPSISTNWYSDQLNFGISIRCVKD